MLRNDRDINGYIVHEMGHNFDIVFGGQNYPGAHAWTEVMDPVMNGLMQGGTAELLESALQRTPFAPYLSDPNATWETCVRGSCPYNREPLWGATGLRLTQLHGVLALRDAHHFAQSEPGGPPFGVDALETFRLKAFAAATQKDLGCYLSAWKWYSSPELASFMAPYGPNPFCADDDGDGVAELGGDCNDASAADVPGASETADGIDNDCNGVVDDLLVAEPSGGDFADDRPVSYPVRIRGAIASPSDADSFVLSIPSDLTMRYRFTPLSFFSGWLFFHLPTGGWQSWAYAAAPNATTGEVPLASGLRRISVEMNAESTLGPYEVLLWQRMPPWGSAMAPQAAASPARLRAVTTASAAFDRTPDAIRFWVTGIGFVGSAPYAADATFDWTAAPGTYSYRAIPVRDGVPVAKASAPVAFTIQAETLAAPANLIAQYDGAGVNVSWAAVAGSTGYRVERNAGSGFETLGTTPALSFRDGTAASGAAYLYRVRAANDLTVSPPSNVDLALARSFTDDPIVPRATRIRAVHFSELRAAIAAARTATALPNPSWRQPLTGTIRAAAVRELYTSLDEVRAQFGAPALTGAPVAGARIRAVDLQRLRDALK